MIRSFITSILSMLATLAIAYGIDQWIVNQQHYARRDLGSSQAYIWVIIGGLVMLAIWLVLGWYIIAKSRRILVVSIIYIVVGLLAFVWFPLELISRFWAIYLFLFSNLVYNFQYSGLFIAALGFLTLLLPKHNSA